METIKLKVSNQCIVADRKYLVSDTKEVYQCEFEFDDEWTSYGKTATFRQNDSITEMVLVNNACVLPYESITQKGYMQIGVYGDNSTKHYPTIWCEPIFVYEGVTEGEEHEDPTPDVYQQIISALNQKEDKSNKVTSLSSSSTDSQYPSAKVVYDELDDKVDKIQGKGLSQNDFTDNLKSKLDGIQNNAEVNVQSDWNQTDSSQDDFIKNKPSIPTLDNYYTKGETDSAISNHHDSTKQNTLVSGTNIKTINNQSILGSGNIEIQGGGGNVDDVKVNNVSVVSNKIANIDLSSYLQSEDSSPSSPLPVNADTLENHSASYFQQALVSGTNVKTINNQSILGSGNITIGQDSEWQEIADITTTEDLSLVDFTSYISSRADIKAIRFIFSDVATTGSGGIGIRPNINGYNNLLMGNTIHPSQYKSKGFCKCWIEDGYLMSECGMGNSSQTHSHAFSSNPYQTYSYINSADFRLQSGSIVSGANIKFYIKTF